jgi:hypothetical protein
MNTKKTTQEYISEVKSKLYYAETIHAAPYESHFIYIDIVQRELDYMERLEAAHGISPTKRPVRLGYMDKLYFPWVRTLTHNQDERTIPPAWPVHTLKRN